MEALGAMFGGGNPWAAQPKPPAEQFEPPSPGPMRASDLRRSSAAAPLSAVREERDFEIPITRESSLEAFLADVVGARILTEGVVADYTGLVERHVCPPSPMTSPTIPQPASIFSFSILPDLERSGAQAACASHSIARRPPPP